MLDTLLGAMVGGAISALVAWLTLRSTQAEARRVRASERRQIAAIGLVTALADARATVLATHGGLLSGDEARMARALLRREIAVFLASVPDSGLDARLGRVLDLLSAETEMITDGYEPDDQALVRMRLAADRINYLDWVILCAQDVASSGVAVRADVAGPAGPDAKEAPAWQPPPPPATAQAVKARRALRGRAGGA